MTHPLGFCVANKSEFMDARKVISIILSTLAGAAGVIALRAEAPPGPPYDPLNGLTIFGQNGVAQVGPDGLSVVVPNQQGGIVTQPLAGNAPSEIFAEPSAAPGTVCQCVCQPCPSCPPCPEPPPCPAVTDSE